MRIIGEIPHPQYKITVFSMNERLSFQIEDSLLTQTYRFRDGSGVGNLNDVKLFLNATFLEDVDNAFLKMRKGYIEQLKEIENEDEMLDLI